jgi:hypothetical protein
MMNLFKKLFTRAKPSAEETFLVSLQRLSDALRPLNSPWANVLAELRDEAANIFASGAPVERRYQLARKTEQLFGGMGSLNDINMPDNCAKLSDALFKATQEILRLYWHKLGRQSQGATITPLPVGSSVRLIPGAVRYFNRDESTVVVTDTPEIKAETWVIVRCEGPDITNMPSYLVKCGDTFMSARHESLELSGQ